MQYNKYLPPNSANGWNIWTRRNDLLLRIKMLLRKGSSEKSIYRDKNKKLLFLYDLIEDGNISIIMIKTIFNYHRKNNNT